MKKVLYLFDHLLSGSRTDIYDALRDTLNLKSEFNPSYRLLITDGFPTKGVVDTRQIINQISDLNNNRVSIFTFGGGISVSQYMLDFVAYKNRGWSTFDYRDYAIAKSLYNAYLKIKDPLLLHLRYHISGVNPSEVYPHIMPDFFKGSEFVVYGTYANEGQIFVQVLGDVLGQTKEFVVNASLADAVKGNKEIARQWAFHKIYYLISQMKTGGNNDDLIRQIDQLSNQYQIITPYSQMFREKPAMAPTKKAQPAKPASAK